MKLLIIDDEQLTREGLFQNIDWKSLRINEVLLADDGINALILAKEHKPEIILSDIRMPRMNGIQLVNKIYEFLPDSNIIFMSGYSDKEYLKAAIKLRAISYVEKPLNQNELEAAILEAVYKVETTKRQKKSTAYHLHGQSSQLALLLTLNDKSNQPHIISLIEHLGLPITERTYITTCLINFQTPISKLTGAIADAFAKWQEILAKNNFFLLYAFKNDKHLIAHIYKNGKPAENLIYSVCSKLQEILVGFCRFFIAIGTTIKGPTEVYKSYHLAVILLQSSFFSEYNEILSRTNSKTDSELWRDQIPAFIQALNEKNLDNSKEIAKSLYSNLKNCQTLLPNQVKDIYYKYFIQIENCLIKNQLFQYDDYQVTESTWETISNCHTLKDLHHLLLEKLEFLFQTLQEGIIENPVVYQIKDFICKNYSIPTLSVKDIGGHVYLSSSYVCTLFKTETGKTLNQYLTEYRINMAKQLLDGSHYKITDISFKIGYSDGNYFSKTFKKYVGLSPSEYREKALT